MDWTRGPTIGRGATATVHLATDNRSGEFFAVKSTELHRSDFLRNEQSFLSKLASPRIIKYLGFSLTTESNTPMYNLRIEYVPKGSLFDTVRSKGKLEEPLIRLYTLQILQGLDHLHRNKIVHCDIKCRNLLIAEDGLRIADLGCAKFIDGSDIDWGKFSGSPAFMAPEVARGEKQGFEADVWALGCVIIEMATGLGPWPRMGDSPALSALYRIGYLDSIPEFPSLFSEQGKDFLTKCFSRDWKQRWTVRELLEHPFLRVSEPDIVFNAAKATSSPSSVLDKALWDSVEACESQQELGFEDCSVLDSALERIKLLVGSESFSSWDCCDDDDDWLTIRSSASFGEDIQFGDQLDFNVDSEEDVTSRLIFYQELSFEFSVENIELGAFSHYSSFVIACNNMDVQSEIKDEKFCFDSISVSFLFCQFKFCLFFFFLYGIFAGIQIFLEVPSLSMCEKGQSFRSREIGVNECVSPTSSDPFPLGLVETYSFGTTFCFMFGLLTNSNFNYYFFYSVTFQIVI